MDRWLLSKCNSLIDAVDQHLDQYEIPEACKALEDFVDEMSNWYVRRCRERFLGTRNGAGQNQRLSDLAAGTCHRV